MKRPSVIIWNGKYSVLNDFCYAEFSPCYILEINSIKPMNWYLQVLLNLFQVCNMVKILHNKNRLKHCIFHCKLSPDELDDNPIESKHEECFYPKQIS